ncbi:MAG: hypothetical protein R3A52_05760 [Polyangiales bacterium]
MTPLRPRGAERTGFTAALEALVRGAREALCAVFVDAEGEAIDVATAIDEFDAKITGAEMALPLARVRAYARARRAGATVEVRFSGERRSVLVRAVAEGCDLVLLVEGAITVALAERVARTAAALASEAGMEPVAGRQTLRAVELSADRPGWPRAFVDGGARRTVAAVLGVREVGTDAHYLVRTDEGEEVLVAHDRELEQWRRES